MHYSFDHHPVRFDMESFCKKVGEGGQAQIETHEWPSKIHDPVCIFYFSALQAPNNKLSPAKQVLSVE